MIAEWCSNCGGETLLPTVNGVGDGLEWDCMHCGDKLLPCAQFDCANGDCCQKETEK